MPTNLPRPSVKPKRSLFSDVLNGLMLVSALALTFVVVAREHGFAKGEPGIFADAIIQLTQQSPDKDADGRPLIPPSN
jgi:hypothetical protein